MANQQKIVKAVLNILDKMAPFEGSNNGFSVSVQNGGAFCIINGDHIETVSQANPDWTAQQVADALYARATGEVEAKARDQALGF